VLRISEVGALNTQKLMWSSRSVEACYREIESTMSKEIPMMEIKQMMDGKLVEGVKFNTKKLVAYLVRHFGLEQYATYGTVEMTITVNAAKLEENATHVMIGYKIVDKQARVPITKR
jgi:hypothetical protein